MPSSGLCLQVPDGWLVADAFEWRKSCSYHQAVWLLFAKNYAVVVGSASLSFPVLIHIMARMSKVNA